MAGGPLAPSRSLDTGVACRYSSPACAEDCISLGLSLHLSRPPTSRLPIVRRPRPVSARTLVEMVDKVCSSPNRVIWLSGPRHTDGQLVDKCHNHCLSVRPSPCKFFDTAQQECMRWVPAFSRGSFSMGNDPFLMKKAFNDMFRQSPRKVCLATVSNQLQTALGRPARITPPFPVELA